MEAKGKHFGLMRFVTQNLRVVRTHSHADAPVTELHALLPVVLLVPGLGLAAPDYTVIAEDLASHGYVVVGITQTGSARLSVLPDGTVEHGREDYDIPERLDERQQEERAESLLNTWLGDVVTVLDGLHVLNESISSSFAHRLDLNQVAVVGHSFGGAVALEACNREKKCVAGINLDGFPYGMARLHGATKPNLTIWSDPSEHPRTNWIAADRAVRASRMAQVELLRATKHFDFTDYAIMFHPPLHFLGLLGRQDGAKTLEKTCKEIGRFLNECLPPAAL
jgi:pimeloyl-ACP methyl ester carboxylesterase